MEQTELKLGENQITITLLDETMGQGLIGMISSPMFKENIAIVIDKCTDPFDYDFACLGCGENSVAPRVTMTKKYMMRLKKKSLLLKLFCYTK